MTPSLTSHVGQTHKFKAESDLEGELPSELSDLTSFTALNIHSNKVIGEIPSTLFELLTLT